MAYIIKCLGSVVDPDNNYVEKLTTIGYLFTHVNIKYAQKFDTISDAYIMIQHICNFHNIGLSPKYHLRFEVIEHEA